MKHTLSITLVSVAFATAGLAGVAQADGVKTRSRGTDSSVSAGARDLAHDGRVATHETDAQVRERKDREALRVRTTTPRARGGGPVTSQRNTQSQSWTRRNANEPHHGFHPIRGTASAIRAGGNAVAVGAVEAAQSLTGRQGDKSMEARSAAQRERMRDNAVNARGELGIRSSSDRDRHDK